MGDLVEVAFVRDEVEAAMIQALLDSGEIPNIQEQVGPSGRQVQTSMLTPGGTRRVMVHAHRAEEARALIAAATAEGEREAPEPVNARYLDEGDGRRGPRSYGLAGAYARIFLVSLVAFGLIFVAWLVSRGL